MVSFQHINHTNEEETQNVPTGSSGNYGGATRPTNQQPFTQSSQANSQHAGAYAYAYPNEPIQPVDFQEIVDGILQTWDNLESRHKQQALLALILGFYFLYNYIFTILVAFAVFQYLTSNKPKADTFLPFFEMWFKVEYYPKLTSKLEKELEIRQQSKMREGNLLGFVGDYLKKTMLSSTKVLQSDIVYSAVVKNSEPIVYSDKLIFLQVKMNLGSRESPSEIVFWGINGRWRLAPYISIDFENIAILDSIQQQAN